MTHITCCHPLTVKSFSLQTLLSGWLFLANKNHLLKVEKSNRHEINYIYIIPLVAIFCQIVYDVIGGINMDLEKQWGCEYRPLNSIIPNKKNPRKASKKAVEKLQKQIKEVGFHACIKVDNNGVILGGNTRYKALHNLLNEGYVDLQVPVMYPKFQLTEKEREQIIITDNVNIGEWDFRTLIEDFDFDDLEEWGLDDLNISFDNPEDEEEEEMPKKREQKMYCRPNCGHVNVKKAFECANSNEY